MNETKQDSENIGTNYILPTATRYEQELKSATVTSIQVQKSDESQGILQREGLTAMQQLKASGTHLLDSMDIVKKNPEFTAMEVVELAKALATTVQTQANLFKALKDFSK